jgi:hypothetical protein
VLKVEAEVRQVLMGSLVQEVLAAVEARRILRNSRSCRMLIIRRQTTRTEGGSKEVTHHNVGGAAGPSGKAGAPSRALLVDGENGADGDVHIFVQKPDGQLAGPFASAYRLEVVEFDIVDGNEDGILEFGEEVVLRNIRVCNSGFTSNLFCL